jgi:hypothetical protein
MVVGKSRIDFRPNGLCPSDSQLPPPEAGGKNPENHPLGVRDPPRLDRNPGRDRAQRNEHLPVLMAVETETRPGASGQLA